MPLAARSAIASSLELSRAEATIRRRLFGELLTLEQRLAADILAADITGPARAAFRLQRLERFLREARSTIRESYHAAALQHAAGLTDLSLAAVTRAGGELEGPASLLARVSGAPVRVGLSRSQVRAAVADSLVEGASVREWWNRQAADAFRRVSDQVRIGAVQRETAEQLAARIAGKRARGTIAAIVKGRRRQFANMTGGALEPMRRAAGSLSATAGRSFTSAARIAAFEANAEMVKGIVQHSTLDSRTSTTCLAYHGKAWSIEDLKPIGHSLPYGSGVPRHWRCRSVEGPLLRSWRELGIPVSQATPALRERFSGKAATLSARQFLDGLSREEAARLLGPGRAAMFRGHRISLTDLVDQSGRPLSLAELRRLTGE